MKICSKCNEEKEDFEFHKDSRNKSGLYSQCKECRVINSKYAFLTDRRFNIKPIIYKGKYDVEAKPSTDPIEMKLDKLVRDTKERMRKRHELIRKTNYGG